MTANARNPGPSWGYGFMRAVDRALPRPVTRVLLGLGAGFALLTMPRQRAHSQRFLAEALGREPTWLDSWRHFSAFANFLMERFRAANGQRPDFRASDASEDRIESLARAKQQALYGTVHFGLSDMMGFWLTRFDLSIRMVRHQVANSQDIEWLDRRFGKRVGFIWVNDPGNLLFALKGAVEAGHSIAMKCDRVEHSSKRERFVFLGRARWFPFTIYHLAILFDLPVVFAFGVPAADGSVEVYSSRRYWPDRSTKSENLAAARQHFRETLRLLERLVREHPYQWFNFLETLPIAEAESTEGALREARCAD